MSSTSTTRPDGWYWVRKKSWGDDYGDWVPAEWKQEFRSWASTRFSGIPDSEMVVGERITAPAVMASEVMAPGRLVTTFEVRQQVRTVNKGWLESVSSNECARIVRMDYDRLVAEYPSAYFELVKIEHKEDCLAFTPGGCNQSRTP